MNISRIHLFVCPVSYEPFQYYILEKKGSHIKEGFLVSAKTRYIYPIINYIPILLDFSTKITTDYILKNSKKIKVGRYRLPNQIPRKGEAYVQKEFSKQWIDHGLSRQSQYGYTDQELSLFVKIQLGKTQKWFKGKSVLNIGCGAGKEAIFLYNYTRTHVAGIDLNFSLLQLGDKVLQYPQIDFVQASLFRLPVKKHSFDYVYSHGVLHHTYSTKEALRSISQYVRPGGFLYIWVYGYRKTTDWYSGLNTMLVQYLIRPVISSFPIFFQNIFVYSIAMISYVFHVFRYVIHKDTIRLSPDFRDILLQIRDSHTVYYSHWQSMAEVLVWLKELKMKNITPLEIEKIPEYLRVGWYGNVGLRSQKNIIRL